MRRHRTKTRQTFTVPEPVFRKFAAVVPPGKRSAVVSELLEAEARKREKALINACMTVNEQAGLHELEADFQSLEDTVAEPFDSESLDRNTPGRGEIWLADLGPLNPAKGAEIQKTRPVLIVGTNVVNRYRRTALVFPLATSGGKRLLIRQ